MLLISFFFMLNALAAACTQQTETCTAEKCEMVGETEICTQCQAGKVPINGKCVEAEGVKNKCTDAGGSNAADQTCKECKGQTFMYKGGCYDKGNVPGSTICKTGDGTEGVCDACEAGYFKSASAAIDKQSCIACNEAETIDTFKGVSNCKVCDAPSGAGAAVCTICEEGFFGATCEACDSTCATCSGAGANKCTKCQPDAGDGKQYLKDGTCVTADECRQAAGYYLDDTPEDKKCMACDSTCATCSGAGANKCTKCKPDAGDGKQYLKDGTCVTADECRQAAGYYLDDTPEDKKCMACDSTCATCSGAGANKCTKCKPDAGDGKQYLKDGACVTDAECKSGAFFPNDELTAGTKTCEACNPACAACSGKLDTQCTKCNPEAPDGKKYLKDGACVTILDCAYDNGHYADDGTKECKVCNSGKRPDTTGTKCVTCSDANCERCDQDNVCARCNTGEPPTGGACPIAERGCHPSCGECTSDAMTNQADKCTSCKGDNYLRVIVSGSGICIPASICASDKSYFAKEVVESTGSKKMCLSCSDATHGIADCKKCSSEASSAQTKLVLVCSDCDTKWLSPLGNACLEKCPAGTYSDRSADNINVCASCHSTCAECDGNAEATSCRACYPGFVLSKGANGVTGACIPECTEKYAENCEAGQCTAVVGGSRYCSRCRAGFAPVDGVCMSTTSRAPTGCTPGNGVCTSCTATYFLESGGCYNARAFPGSTLCTTASDGKCTNCANGQEKDGQGSCPACPDGCSKCATSGSPKACSECLPGYYKSGGSCIKCDANDSQITGVANCVSCAPPSGGSGPVICYVTKDGGSGGGSTNKSGLSTGAIAGIAVAVVVVVGGLVGFLCWWFICRGRA